MSVLNSLTIKSRPDKKEWVYPS